MPTIHHAPPAHRACAWCAQEFAVVRRPGRPRLYCHHACRQRAYEHRHGFTHERTVRPLPGQYRGEGWSGSGYERGGLAILKDKAHALRTSVRPEGRRRETLCGVLAPPVNGTHFSPRHPKACRTCSTIVERTPLRIGVSPSNELALLRALLDEAREQRVDPRHLVGWIASNSP